MARTLVDTSAFVALIDETDPNHLRATRWMDEGAEATRRGVPPEILVTHSYVVVETVAVLHRKLGTAAARDFLEDLLPFVAEPFFVDRDTHRAAVSAYLAAGRKRLSLVDTVSFEVMRHLNLDRAFAFDRDFGTAGFETVP